MKAFTPSEVTKKMNSTSNGTKLLFNNKILIKTKYGVDILCDGIISSESDSGVSKVFLINSQCKIHWNNLTTESKKEISQIL